MCWEYYISKSSDVYFNLALEEYFIRHFSFVDRRILLIYRNSPAIVLGKNQNVLKEVNQRFHIANPEYKFARRISGGGTVVHDMGNINIAIFEPYNITQVNRYDTSSGKIVEALNSLGVKCHLNDRNAIILANRHKVSGSAQFSNRNVIMSHLTLLYQSDLDKITKALQPNSYFISTKASPSVASVIDNIGGYLDLPIDNFIDYLISFFGIKNTIDENLIEKNKHKLLIEKYSNKDYYYDLALNGVVKRGDLSIEFSQGKIIAVNGWEAEKNYIGKRLLTDEIPLTDKIWRVLL